ncbi:MAG: thiamine-phosphate kinase [Sphingomonadales bacterium]|nr:thiamine-phosphate kinase [Sphingomonadales bacterium]MDE2168636.1 thiamine-phosphate kinase [Sphingomonadales bacterium]
MAGELDFIARLRALARHPAARGLNDDCAVLPLGTGTGSETLILTHDAMAQGVHYLPTQDMADVAWKLVASNLSDLAAKGAQPLGVLLGYSLGGDDTRFLEGLAQVLDHYDTPLLGGDTIRVDGPLSFGLTAVGRATHLPVPSRSGARPGDAIWITGGVGAAMMGFEALQAGHDDPALTVAFRRPEALVAEGQSLAPLVTAMMDVSDGVLLDAWRMGTASGVTMAIDSAAVPLRAPEERRRDALSWGEDYQLLFTAPAGCLLPVEATRIGEVRTKGDAPLLLDGVTMRESDHLGWHHKG